MKYQSHPTTIITETEDDKIVSYLAEKIILELSSNSDYSKKHGVVAAAMNDKDFLNKYKDIENTLKLIEPKMLRQSIAECIVLRKPLNTIYKIKE